VHHLRDIARESALRMAAARGDFQFLLEFFDFRPRAKSEVTSGTGTTSRSSAFSQNDRTGMATVLPGSSQIVPASVFPNSFRGGRE